MAFLNPVTFFICNRMFGLGRRQKMYWTKAEEEYLVVAVAKHGLGRWKKILREGKDVFHPHRTNVDLKVSRVLNVVGKTPQSD